MSVYFLNGAVCVGVWGRGLSLLTENSLTLFGIRRCFFIVLREMGDLLKFII